MMPSSSSIDSIAFPTHTSKYCSKPSPMASETSPNNPCAYSRSSAKSSSNPDSATRTAKSFVCASINVCSRSEEINIPNTSSALARTLNSASLVKLKHFVSLGSKSRKNSCTLRPHDAVAEASADKSISRTCGLASLSIAKNTMSNSGLTYSSTSPCKSSNHASMAYIMRSCTLFTRSLGKVKNRAGSTCLCKSRQPASMVKFKCSANCPSVNAAAPRTAACSSANRGTTFGMICAACARTPSQHPSVTTPSTATAA
mmetsp:Transcript_5450/g.12043  ORF Transcript_5450/g.12043 Transcript_5450/m.12043 type:complete len:257 (-) Transcript_5450:826-1596(-)